MSERETIIDLIREHHDPMPSHWHAREVDNWDDGTGFIADAILADKMLLIRKHDNEREALVKALQLIMDMSNDSFARNIAENILTERKLPLS
jgi:hypothetical protein